VLTAEEVGVIERVFGPLWWWCFFVRHILCSLSRQTPLQDLGSPEP